MLGGTSKVGRVKRGKKKRGGDFRFPCGNPFGFVMPYQLGG